MAQKAQNRRSNNEVEEGSTMFRRLIKLAVVGWIVSMIAGSIAALSVKRRLVPTTDESADEIVAVAIFGPLAFHSTAQAFRGGVLECWYGGGMIDLRDAVLAPEGATLNVRAIFGGGQLLVPADWKVVSRIRGLGGVTDVRPAKGYEAAAPELVVEGMLFAAGFVVSSEVPDEAKWLEGMKDKAGYESWSDDKAETAAATETEAETADGIEPAAETEPEASGETGAEPEPSSSEEMAPAS